jgi:hypothetical protein
MPGAQVPKRRVVLLVVASLLLLWLLVPKTEIVSPDWTVLITDKEGHPLQGASVTVFSQQYTVEAHDHEETRITGDDGVVSFKQRKIHSTGFMRLLGVVRNLDQGVHASFGVHTHLSASKQGYGDPTELALFGENERNSRANGSAQQTSHVVLLKCSSGYSGFGCDFPDDSAKPVLPLNAGH